MLQLERYVYMYLLHCVFMLSEINCIFIYDVSLFDLHDCTTPNKYQVFKWTNNNYLVKTHMLASCQ